MLEATEGVTGVSSSGNSSTPVEGRDDGMQEHSMDLLFLAPLSRVGMGIEPPQVWNERGLALPWDWERLRNTLSTLWG